MTTYACHEESKATADPELSTLVKQVLVNLGEDPMREGASLKTPDRVARSLKELTCGYQVNVDQLINDALFDVPYSEMVLVRDIDFIHCASIICSPFSANVMWRISRMGKSSGFLKFHGWWKPSPGTFRFRND